MYLYLSIVLLALASEAAEPKKPYNSELGPLGERIHEGIADGEKVPIVAFKLFEKSATSTQPSASSSSLAPSSSTSPATSSSNSVTAPPDVPLPANLGGSGVPEIPGGGNQLASIPNPIAGLIGAIQLAQSLTQQTIGQFTRLVHQLNQYTNRLVSG